MNQRPFTLEEPILAEGGFYREQRDASLDGAKPLDISDVPGRLIVRRAHRAARRRWRGARRWCGAAPPPCERSGGAGGRHHRAREATPRGPTSMPLSYPTFFAARLKNPAAPKETSPFRTPSRS